MISRETLKSELSRSHRWLFPLFREWFYDWVCAETGCEPSEEYEWQAFDFFKRYVRFEEGKTKSFQGRIRNSTEAVRKPKVLDKRKEEG